MGTDPARSVVNEWGRSHDVKNLFIVDSSLFVTSGGVNPTSTIQALALYIADQMKQRLANLFDSGEKCPSTAPLPRLRATIYAR
jgi:choline dehydrogenase-like flavoprotein